MENSKALYVYGIVPNGEGEIPTRLPASPAKRGEPARQVKRIDSNGPVRFFPYQGIAAVVSEVELEEFSESALAENLKNLEWVKEKIWAHEKVLENVMKTETVIPMKFGAIFTSEERLEKVLADSYDGFKTLLEKLAGRLEWAVKIYGDSEALKASVEKTNPRIQALSSEIAQKPAGEAYLLRRKLEITLTEEVDLETGKRLREIFNRLSVHTAEAKLGELSPRELTGKEKQMIFNGIFLVGEEKVNRLTDEVANLTMEMSDLGWEFQPVGPFPPYNFSEISPVKEVQR